MGISGLFEPLAPERNDPVDNEPRSYGLVLLTVIVASTVGTYLMGVAVAPLGLDYIVASVPFFFLMIFCEAILLKCGAVKNSEGAQYSAADTWSSIAAGVTQMLWVTFVKRFASHAVLYTWVWNSFHVVDVTRQSWGVLVACFVASDFMYYWFHRMAHEYAALWAGHNVHHSSEHYNLSTALRQSWRQALLSPFWSLPFALVLPPTEFFVASQWVTIYQFWIHTCVIRRLGWVEYVLNTPSHHRCHHDRRLHKNFAGVFIIWDRMFGTFQDELALTDDKDVASSDRVRGESCYFGIKEVVNTWSEPAVQLMMVLQQRQWFRGPGYDTSTAHRPLPKYAPRDAIACLRLSESFSREAKVYLWVQFLMVLGLFGVVVADQPQWERWEDALQLVSFTLVSLTCQGLLLDGGNASWCVELLRCVVGVILFESWAWYSLSWFHVASFVVVLLRKDALLVCGREHAKQD